MDEENNPRGFNSQKSTGYIPNFGKPTINPKTTKKQSDFEQRRRKELEEKMK